MLAGKYLCIANTNARQQQPFLYNISEKAIGWQLIWGGRYAELAANRNSDLIYS